MKSPIVLAVAICTALLAGIAIGRWELLFPTPTTSGNSPRPADATASAEMFQSDPRTSDSKSAEYAATPLASEVTAALSNNDPWRRRAMVSALSLEITAENARPVLDHLRSAARTPDRDFLVAQILNAWARLAPAAAMAYAENIEPGIGRWNAIVEAHSGWYQTDREGALVWLEKQPPGFVKTEGWRSIISTVADNDPDRALDMVLASSGGDLGAVFPIFQAWANEGVITAAARVEALPPGELRNRGLGFVALMWAASDPAAAVDWAGNVEPANAREQALSTVLSNWARNDADAVIQWFSEQPGKPSIRQIQNLSTGLAHMDNPSAAIRLAALLEDPREQDQTLSNIARIWSEKDPKGAWAWAESQSDPTLQEAIWPSVVSGIARNDPEAAVALTLTLPEGDTKRNGLARLATQWVNNNPLAAANWANKLESADVRREVVAKVMSNWSQVDTEDALHWFASVPDGDVRDYTIENISSRLVQFDPMLAMQIVQSMSDEKRRGYEIVNTFTNWHRRDPAAAVAWAAQAELPRETREQINLRAQP